MCGIVAYIGSRPAPEILLNGLRRLEYRGYDSAGLTVMSAGLLATLKAPGKVQALADEVARDWSEDKRMAAHCGIAHTRWATHGPPTRENSHPHLDQSGRIALVHNGIIENYAALKERLSARGHVFKSQTDTEVLSHLVGEFFRGDLAAAVAEAIRHVSGTFGIAVISEDQPGLIVCARRGSPIVIGIGDGETLVASDVSALVQHTRRVIYLDDNDIATISADGVEIRDLSLSPVARSEHSVDWDLAAAEKAGYDHFMIKEIHDQPEALRNACRGRLDLEDGSAVLGGLNLTPREMSTCGRFLFFACGTSLNACQLGALWMEEFAGIPSQATQAAEFRYRNPIVEPGTFAVAVSQSGETADTLAAVREARRKGAELISICNVVGSTIARETGRGVYLHAGPEQSVASTKAFTAQAAVLLQLAVKFGRSRRLSREQGHAVLKALDEVPALVEQLLANQEIFAAAGRRIAQASSMFCIGRGLLFPVAIETALKIKEVSYIHAEGYHAAELKHGPIALLEAGVPVLAFADDIPGRDKVLSNIQECRARGATIIATITEGDHEAAALCDIAIPLPRSSHPAVTPFLCAIAGQLVAYYAAAARGCSIDHPRNLAKSVTVE